LMLHLALLRIATDRPMENFPSCSGDGVRWGWGAEGNRARRGWHHGVAGDGPPRVGQTGALIMLRASKDTPNRCARYSVESLRGQNRMAPVPPIGWSEVHPDVSLVPDVRVLVVLISYTTKYYL
jgi:hypothetical protein